MSSALKIHSGRVSDVSKLGQQIDAEPAFVWTGRHDRRWPRTVQVVVTCAACAGLGHYIGRGAISDDLADQGTQRIVQERAQLSGTRPKPSNGVASTGAPDDGKLKPNRMAVPDATERQDLNQNQVEKATVGPDKQTSLIEGERQRSADIVEPREPATKARKKTSEGLSTERFDGNYASRRAGAAKPRAAPRLSDRAAPRSKSGQQRSYHELRASVLGEL